MILLPELIQQDAFNPRSGCQAPPLTTRRFLRYAPIIALFGILLCGGHHASAEAAETKQSTQDNQDKCEIALADTLYNAALYDSSIEQYKNGLTNSNCSGEDKLKIPEQLKAVLKNKSTNACSAANKALELGQLKTAKTMYDKMLENDPLKVETKMECAVEGLSAVASKYVSFGDRLNSVKDYAGAARMYTQAVEIAEYDTLIDKIERGKIEPDQIPAVVAQTVAGKLRAATHNKQTHYIELLSRLDEGEALKKLHSFLENDPSFAEKAREYRFVGGWTVPFWETLRQKTVADIVGYIGTEKNTEDTRTDSQQDHKNKLLDNGSDVNRGVLPYISDVAGSVWAIVAKVSALYFTYAYDWYKYMWGSFIGLPLLSAFVVIVVVYLIGRRYVWSSPLLEIDGFTKSNDSAQKDDAFARELEHQLVHLSSEVYSRGGVAMVSSTIPAGSVPNLAASLPVASVSANPIQWLLAVVPLVLPKRSLCVRGLVHEAGSNLKGVTIWITWGPNVVESHSLWAEDFRTPDQQDGTDLSTCTTDLSMCAAAWVFFNTRKHLNPRYSIRKSQKHEKILGTSNWKAYASFLVGNEAVERGDQKRAETAYLNSLLDDPKFSPSRINLAAVLHHLSDGVEDEQERKELLNRALQQLDAVRDGVEDEPKQELFKRLRYDPRRYAYSFRRMAILLDLAPPQEGADPKKKDDSRKRQTEAIDEAEELINGIKYALENKEYGGSDFQAFLKWRLPIAESVLLGLTAIVKSVDDKARDELEKVSRNLESRVDFHSLYNLACTYALFASASSKMDDKQKKNYEDRSLDLLKRSIEFASSIYPELRMKGIKNRAKKDGTLSCLRKEVRFKDIVGHSLPTANYSI